MKIKWWSSAGTMGAEREDTIEIDDKEIEEMRKAGWTELAIEEWIEKEVKEEVMNYFEWGYEIE